MHLDRRRLDPCQRAGTGSGRHKPRREPRRKSCQPQHGSAEHQRTAATSDAEGSAKPMTCRSQGGPSTSASTAATPSSSAAASGCAHARRPAPGRRPAGPAPAGTRRTPAPGRPRCERLLAAHACGHHRTSSREPATAAIPRPCTRPTARLPRANGEAPAAAAAAPSGPRRPARPRTRPSRRGR